ncbi:indolepyruvate ferredoxin oxidoreductase family protein [Shimia sagamensis]|uniref:Indolepyruvate ferredoxin oxidoreductase n=1 Tax=Shimia sagamensis TaxID=1566352 RepID=A0ABY1PL83_9RHOB|nr:indolepyruvate ferredoxin oxidoreductase family protein [Shimia sagamensis]SMP35813.1 indolepyruvate ferredoxin oxidoreductase [Shimia sagamensis]
MTKASHEFDSYALSDRYDRTTGRVFLTGTQALVRIMFDQARRDREAGLNTGGFVSGYRGSPLGGVDLEFWRERKRTKEQNITFMPAVNEDLGATAVLGAQQATLDPECDVEGLFSMWYGKGPGVDRSGDALKHGNAYGSSSKGGVLVVAGDDHGCVSSSMPHQSDVAFMSWFMPTLNPASVDEYQAFGEYGIALSRFSGTWVGFKAISETVESGRSVELQADRQFVEPEFEMPAGGLHVRPSDLPSPDIETRISHKLRAVEAFVEANPIDQRIYGIDEATFGFVTTGKGHLDLMEALRLLGLDETACRRLGIDIYKVGMVWPLARRDALSFVRGKTEVLVVEEKRGIIESQFKEYFYDWPGDKPEKMVGKHRAAGDPLLPWTGELSPKMLVPVVAERLARLFPEERLLEKAAALTEEKPPVLNVEGANRTPYFCSGCPHNTSTKLPDGSKAMSGIGCHVMASWMNRETGGYAQMGGEGVPVAVAQKYNGNKHIFQNLGEGTWYHSGSLAIRQAVAANANITYKVLFNDAVAMTGGQPVDGPVSVHGIAWNARAEGVARIALVSDNIGKFDKSDFPPDTSFHDRADLDPVQRELREIEGVTLLVYEQTCATEKRRRRKRGTMEDPDTFAYINELVCEGCGDCSKASNCLSVEPVETEFGRKRKINLSTCNKDFSCVDGFCPSFVTVEGAKRRKKYGADVDVATLLALLPSPKVPSLDRPFDLLVTGVGGTGVVTVGALITMAAHLEGMGSSVLDFTGFAQKFGTVLSYIRLGANPAAVNQVRIESGAADAVIGCDVVVSSAPKASMHYRKGAQIVLNTAEMPTGDLVLNRDADLKVGVREDVIRKAVGAENVRALNANKMAEKMMGDSVFANVMMLGFAYQRGLVPVSEMALKQAVLLNGVAVEKNAKAFDIGRVLAHDPDAFSWEKPRKEETVDAVIAKRVAFLSDYQNVAYARRFEQRIADLARVLPDDLLIEAAKSLFKLMAYKDEYEVARLQLDRQFEVRLHKEFEGEFKVNYHMSPPILPLGRDAEGRPKKIKLGPWMRPVLGALAKARGLRGSMLDVFRFSADRKLDLELLLWFEGVLDLVEKGYGAGNRDTCWALLTAPKEIRGYGVVREVSADKARKSVTMLETMLSAKI